MEPELVAFLTQDFGQDGIATVKDGDSAFALLSDLSENLVPVGSACDGARLETGKQIELLLMLKI